MFVVFEGIDGSGKTTISNRVVDRLKAQGRTVMHLRADGKFVSSVSESIRSLARDSRHFELDPKTEFLLYVARDVQLMEESLRGALASYDVVIADRFLYTAEVLARFGRGLSPDFVAPVMKAAGSGLEPDLVVLIDVEPALARARRKAQKVGNKQAKVPSRKGLSGVGLAHRLRRGYQELASESPARWHTVSNDAPLEAAVGDVADLIEESLQHGVAQALAQVRQRPSFERVRTGVDSADAALERFLCLLSLRAEREPQVAAYLLGGLSGPKVDDLRCALARHAPAVILGGLEGLNDEVSWQLREDLSVLHPAQVARTLTGVAGRSERGRVMRRDLFERAPSDVLKGLGRHDGDAQAWDLRERAIREHPEAVLGSLSGLDDDRAWEVRGGILRRHKRELGEHHGLARAVAKSVRGLDGEQAWSLRDQAKQSAPLAVLGSLAYVDSPRSFEMRRQFMRSAPKGVMESLRKLNHPQAWDMRVQAAPETKEAVDGIVGFDQAEAWELRTASADIWPSTVVKSLGRLSDTERGQALLERQLANHGENLSLLKHAAAIALGVHRHTEGV